MATNAPPKNSGSGGVSYRGFREEQFFRVGASTAGGLVIGAVVGSLFETGWAHSIEAGAAIGGVLSFAFAIWLAVRDCRCWRKAAERSIANNSGAKNNEE